MPDHPPLAADEHILWTGAPLPRLRFGIETVGTSIFAGAIALAALGLATVIDRSEAGLFWPIFLPGIMLGLLVIFAYPVWDRIQTQGTHYILTNKRAFILGRKNPMITDHDRKGYPIPASDLLIYQSGNPPSIYFGRRPVGQRHVSGGRYTDVGFERIADADKIYPIMRDLSGGTL